MVIHSPTIIKNQTVTVGIVTVTIMVITHNVYTMPLTLVAITLFLEPTIITYTPVVTLRTMAVIHMLTMTHRTIITTT